MRRQQLIAVLFFGGILSVSLFICNKSLVKDQIVNNDQKFYSNLLPESSSNEVHHESYYSYSYLKEHELSEWTIYLSTKSRLLDSSVVDRGGNFKQNTNVISSISIGDYRNSGYDIVHLVPIEDMSFNSIAMNESFYYTNTTPQTPSLNKGIWKKLEDKVREWTIEYDSLIIITGCVFKDSLNYTTPKIGKVSVPAFYYKIIIDMQRMSSIAFAIPNYPKENELISYVYSIHDLEKVTGTDFFYKLPDSVETVLEYKEQDLAIQEEELEVLRKEGDNSKVLIEGDEKVETSSTNEGDYEFETDLTAAELVKIETSGYIYPDRVGRLFRNISNPITIRLDTFKNDVLSATKNLRNSINDLIVTCDEGGVVKEVFYDLPAAHYAQLYSVKLFSNSYLPYHQKPKYKNNKLESVTISVRWGKVLLAKKQFLVIDKVPPPNAFILFSRDGRISKKELELAGGIIIASKGARYMITSYRFSGVYKGQQMKEDAKGPKFTPKMLEIINNTKSGNAITISNINAIRIGSQEDILIYDVFSKFRHSCWSLENPPKFIKLDPLVIEIE